MGPTNPSSGPNLSVGTDTKPQSARRANEKSLTERKGFIVLGTVLEEVSPLNNLSPAHSFLSERQQSSIEFVFCLEWIVSQQSVPMQTGYVFSFEFTKGKDFGLSEG